LNEKFKKIVRYVFVGFVAILLLGSVSANIGLGLSDRYFRNLSEQYRTELAAATATNNELGRKLEESRRVIEDCSRTTTELRDTTNRNITTARGAIELLRDIREKVVLLESRLSDSNDISNSNDNCAPSDEVNECLK
jgi:uncharacterized protein YhaN